MFSIKEEGLSTGLSLMNSTKAAPPCLKALEDFLHQFEQTIWERIVTCKREFQTQKDAKFSKVFKSLGKSEEVVVVPTDKTNSYKVALLEDYKRWVKNTLKKMQLKYNVEMLLKSTQRQRSMQKV
eukprot:1943777-Ditylum_brightwellii.AAC.1